MAKLLINRNQLLSNFQTFKKAFPDFNTAYAIKANPHQEVIRILRKEGAYFETASLSEIRSLLEDGIEPYKIIFSNPVKEMDAIEYSVNNGIVRMVFDSLTELKKIETIQKKTGKTIHAIFRIVVSNEGSMWPLTKKFGSSRKFWDGIFQYASQYDIFIEGITFHVGSQAESLDVWTSAMERAREAFQIAYQYNLKPDLLNIGGGFPIYLGRSIPSIFEIADVVYHHLNLWKNSEINIRTLYAEPGRYISGSAGTLMAKVIGIAQREEYKWIFLDIGVFNGVMETIDGISYPVLSTGTGKKEKVVFCGPSCDAIDRLFEAEIPEPQINDRIYFSGTGAYTTVYASSFNGFSQPDIVFMDNFSDSQLQDDFDMQFLQNNDFI